VIKDNNAIIFIDKKLLSKSVYNKVNNKNWWWIMIHC